MDARRLRRIPSSPFSSLLLRYPSSTIRARGEKRLQSCCNLAGGLLFLSTLLLVAEKATAQTESSVASPAEPLSALRAGNLSAGAPAATARTGSSSAEFHSVKDSKIEVKREEQQRQVAGFKSIDVRKSREKAISTPITVENFFNYHRNGGAGNSDGLRTERSTSESVDKTQEETPVRRASRQGHRVEEDGSVSSPGITTFPAVPAETGATQRAAAEAETAATETAEAEPAAEAATETATEKELAAQGVTEGAEESAVLSSNGERTVGTEEEVKASLHDIAALAAAAAAAVAALNNGRAEFTEAEEETTGQESLPEALWPTELDAAEQPPVETIQKLAQMVQEAREDDLSVFDPVDSRGKKTIILRDWYTTTVASTMVGRRETDEDALLVGAPSAVRDDVRFKAVFDGHGGEQTSEYCADNVSRYLGVLKTFSFKSIKEACLRMDADVLEAFGPRNVAGSTGVIAIIEKIHTARKVTAFGREILPEDPAEAAHFIPVEVQLQQEQLAEDPVGAKRYTPPSKHTVTLAPGSFLLTIVNIGDSRAMLFHKDGTLTRLSKDHKPSNPVERERVEKAGGFVSNIGNDVPRVDGVLALSRAFGDSDFKAEEGLPPDQQRVVAVPDVRHFYVLPSDMLVMACDGFSPFRRIETFCLPPYTWGNTKNLGLFEPYGMDWKYVHDVAIEELRASNDLEKMVSRMMDYAFAMNSHDNISVLVTTFHKEKFTKPTIIYKNVSGRGEVIQEAKLPGDEDVYPTVSDAVVSLH